MKMRHILYGLLIAGCSYLFAGVPVFVHYQPESAVKGEALRLDLNIMSFDANIYEGRLFYRERGQADYLSVPMQEQGYTMSATLNTSQINSGHVEYYFAMQTMDGNVFTYPEANAANEPLSFILSAGSEGPAAAYQSRVEILILSPEPNDVVPQDELLLAISVPDADAAIDHDRTRLLIDGVNVTTLMDRDGTLYTFSPQNIRTGIHNVEFKLFDSNGNPVGSTEWSFRVSSSASAAEAGFRQRTTLFADNRYQNISERSDNFFRGGFDWDAGYNAWDFYLRGRFSSDEGFSGQSPNRVGAYVAYNFSPDFRMYVRGGDFSGDYDPLVFWNRRVLGFGVGMKSSFFDLDVTAGQTAKGVEGEAVIAGSDTTITRFGTYEQSFLAIRPVFHFGKHVDWGLNLVNGKEDPGSIKFGANPRESLVLGTTLNLNFDASRVRVMSSVQASIANSDATTEVDFDTLADRYELEGSEKDLAESFVNFMESTGFLTLTQGLAPLPNLAMQFEMALNYFNNNLRFTYKNIEADYVTAGNPYLLKGIRGFFITDNIRLFENQVFLNLYYKNYTDNLSQENAETDNSDLGASLSYFPLQSLPSITLSFGNQSRDNGNTPADNIYRGGALYPENNTTQRVSLASTYSFFTGSIRNTATFSVSNVTRDNNFLTRVENTMTPAAGDSMDISNNSDFNVFSLSFKNDWEFPLTTRFGFSQSTSTLGENASNETTNDINRFFGHVEYRFDKAFADVNIKPFFTLGLQQVDNVSSTFDQNYNRLNYSAGLFFNSRDLGNLSLRMDYIDYGDRPNIDYQDTIIVTRYDVTF